VPDGKRKKKCVVKTKKKRGEENACQITSGEKSPLFSKARDPIKSTTKGNKPTAPETTYQKGPAGGKTKSASAPVKTKSSRNIHTKKNELQGMKKFAKGK